VIGLLKTNFAEYGIPAVVHTDKGAQFVSGEFRAFEAPGVTLKPKVPSNEWFHQSHGQNGKEHHGKGKRVRF